MLKDAWQAVANTPSFFTALLERPARIPKAIVTAGVSVLLALIVIAIALVRVTASAALPVVFFVIVAGLINWLLLLALGGLVVMRPAQLDVRAWELVAWAWVPAGYIALSLLAVTFFFPAVALLMGIVVFNAWHLSLLYTGLRSFAPGRSVTASVWYTFAVLLAPWMLLVSSYLLIMANSR